MLAGEWLTLQCRKCATGGGWVIEDAGYLDHLSDG